MEKNPRIGAVVLAAGLSRRAGTVNKLLSPVNGKAMVRGVVDMLSALPIDPVVVVTGFEAPEIEKTLSGCPVIFAHNANFADGMGGSIGCGVTALPDDVDGVMICLGDMPHVKASTIRKLIEAFKGKEICVPVRDGRQGNPVLFSSTYFSALKSIQGDKGGKSLIQDMHENVGFVAVEDTGIFIDHDRIT